MEKMGLFTIAGMAVIGPSAVVDGPGHYYDSAGSPRMMAADTNACRRYMESSYEFPGASCFQPAGSA
jgi:hypothetical protein